MQIDYLVEFIELAERLNFTRAAQALNLSQSALSKHIASLEDEFGGNLFDRSEGRVRLTRFGRSFYEHAAAVLAGYEDLMACGKTCSGGRELSTVRIGGNTILPSVQALISRAQLFASSDELPVRFEYRRTRGLSGEQPPASALDMLRAGNIDIACSLLAVGCSCLDALDCRPVIEEPLVVFTSSENSLLVRKGLRLADLSGSILAILAIYPDCPTVMSAAFDAAGFTSLRTRVIPVGDMLEVPEHLGKMQPNEVTPLQLSLAQGLGLLEHAPEGLGQLDVADDGAHVTVYVVTAKEESRPDILRARDLLCDVRLGQ